MFGEDLSDAIRWRVARDDADRLEDDARRLNAITEKYEKKTLAMYAIRELTDAWFDHEHHTLARAEHLINKIGELLEAT
jgi:hypothetical protein